MHSRGRQTGQTKTKVVPLTLPSYAALLLKLRLHGLAYSNGLCCPGPGAPEILGDGSDLDRDERKLSGTGVRASECVGV